MGDGGDELRLQLLIFADLQGHVVDVVHQLTHLVGVAVGDLIAVAAAGDLLGGLADGGDGRHDVVDQQQAGDDDDKDHRRHDGQDDQHRQQHLAVQIAGGGDKAHDAHHVAVEFQQAGGGDDLLAGGGVQAAEAADPTGAEGVGDILGAGDAAHQQALGGDLHLAVPTVDELQLDGAAVLKAAGVQGGIVVIFVIAAHDVGIEIIRTGGGFGLQRAAGVGVVVAAQGDGDQRGDQHQNGDDRQDAADDPAAAQADGPSGLSGMFLLRHASPSLRGGVGGAHWPHL